MRRTLIAFVLSVGLVAAGAGSAQGGIYPYGGLSFGPQTIGTASAPQTLNVNLGQSDSISSFQIAYPGSLCAPLCANAVPQPDFVATSDCRMYVSGSQNCHIDVTFRPLYAPAGPRSATLWVVPGPYSIPLSGTARQPHRKKCKKHRSAANAKKKCKKRH
jgi:hypothetical protein